jgi:putative SOS response-associated peptidase YedK
VGDHAEAPGKGIPHCPVHNCFFEWKRAGEKKKQPYCIRPKDEDLFAFAGLWEHWEDQEAGQKIDSCTIVTTQANEFVAELHDRMPVIIGKENFDLWLDRSVEDPERLQPLLALFQVIRWSSLAHLICL